MFKPTPSPRHIPDTSPGDLQEAEAVARLRAEPRGDDPAVEAEFGAPVTDKWCGPVGFADERSERAWEQMGRYGEERDPQRFP